MPLYFLLAAALVAVDQVVKYLVRAGIPLHTAVDFLPGLDLTYVQNTGAAFSLFSQHTWLLTLLSGVVSVVLVICLGKRVLPHWSGMLALALLLGGAVGNFIDRLLFGFVTDMFQTTFMNFPVAFFWQLIYAGPIVRFIFRHIFRENEAVQAVSASAE